jgi:hypothetical protein
MSNKGDLQLSDGRHVFLVALDQSRTYEGVLEGIPTKERNRATIERAVQRAEQMWPGKCLLIEPIEIPITMEKEYPFGTPARIPIVQCIGRFRSFKPAHRTDLAWSELTVLWFQSEYAFPIDETVIAHLESIDWETHAEDYMP